MPLDEFYDYIQLYNREVEIKNKSGGGSDFGDL